MSLLQVTKQYKVEHSVIYVIIYIYSINTWEPAGYDPYSSPLESVYLWCLLQFAFHSGSYVWILHFLTS